MPEGGADAAADGPEATVRRAAAPQRNGGPGRWGLLLALIVSQVGVHAAMSGVRVAVPLLALGEGYSPFAVGVLMALFAAAPALLVMRAGRLADRHGYHRPMAYAVTATVLGALLALAATALAGAVHFALLCAASALCGAGANIGMIAVLRTAGRSASNVAERVRVFSWLALAPALANAVGPVATGILIDASGFRAAFASMGVLALASWWAARRVPPEAPSRAEARTRRTSWDLLALPGMARLLAANWLLAACWDVHGFAVPILGHERGFSASTIGFVLGLFPLAVSAVRLAVPLLAHRLDHVTVLRGAMVATAAVFAAYPLVRDPWQMAACAIGLGLSLGAVQPMVMSTLHQLAPEDRHGEAIALRSLTINASSTLMPLLFGVAGSALGVGPVFWIVGAAVGAGNWIVRPRMLGG